MILYDREVERSRSWYNLPTDCAALEMASQLFARVTEIDTLTIDRQEDILRCAALYGKTSASPGGTRLLERNGRQPRGINVLSNAIDTLVSSVTQTTPAPMALTTGGTYDERLRAEQLNSYWSCAFTKYGVKRIGPNIVRDSVIAGTGILRIEPNEMGDGITVERVLPLQLLVDDVSCVDVAPQDFYICKPVSKDRLMDLYPEQADAIRASGPPPTLANYNFWGGRNAPSSMDRENDIAGVVEAWHCKSGPNAPPGRHVVATSQCVLLDEEYDFEDPPLAFLRPVPPQQGWWPELIVDRAAPLQLELNKYAARTADALHLHARPIIFIDKSIGEIKPQITNGVGSIIPVNGGGSGVRQFSPAAMNPEVYNWMRELKGLIFEVLGISQLSAQSLKPAGLNSGAAIRAYNDTQSRRFINFERAWEDLHVDIARLMVRAERQVNASAGVVVKRYGARVRVQWEDIDLDDDSFEITLMPASALPNTPGGRLAALHDMKDLGVIDEEDVIRMADVPDLKHVRDAKVAPREIIEWQIHKILSGEEDLGGARPMPEQNLQLCVEMASRSLQSAYLQGAPADRLDLLRDYMGEAQQLLSLAQGPPPAPVAAPDMGLPPEMAGAPPGPPLPGGAPMPPMPPEGLPPEAMTPMPPMPAGAAA